jgi:hypothetical protein
MKHNLNTMYRHFMEYINKEPMYLENKSYKKDEFTLVNSSRGAYTLKPVNTSLRMQQKEKTTDSNILVIREAISYYTATQMEKNYNYGVEVLSLLKHKMLCEAAKYKLLRECKVISFVKPDGSIFTDLQRFAGYEISLEVRFNDEK